MCYGLQMFLQTNAPDTIYKLTEFEWAEYKDLAKQFLTLIIGVLVLSVTFSEKIVDYQKASRWQKAAVVTTWASLIGALLCTGLSIWIMYQCALFAMYGHYSLRPNTGDVPEVDWAYISINIGGLLFGFSLICIVATGMLTLFKRPDPNKSAVVFNSNLTD